MKTLTVIQEDHPGLMAEVTTLLQQSEIDIRDFSGQVVGMTAVLTFETDDNRRSFRLLTDAGFRVIASVHLLVKITDQPGALARLSSALAEAGLEIRGMHIINRDEAACIVAMETADHEAARTVLEAAQGALGEVVD